MPTVQARAIAKARTMTEEQVPEAFVDNPTLLTEDWIRLAKEVLIREGIAAVKIDRLARDCGVTRGGFYWRFRNRGELLKALIEDWKSTNTAPILQALTGNDAPLIRFERLVKVWIDERDFSPQYDAAIRHWSLADAAVRREVRLIDNIRIDALAGLFAELGYNCDEAKVRARVTYYHQVGYYTIGMFEPDHERERLARIYSTILTGMPAN